MPMNPEVKARWGEWLLAHSSEQGTGWLRQETEEGDRFCCLGGLCELAAEAGIVTRTRLESEEEGNMYAYQGDEAWDSETEVLPRAVMEWAGLNDDNPVVVQVTAEKDALAELNDQGVSFPRIWQLIDAQL